MTPERQHFSAPQQFLKDAFGAGAFKALRHEPLADEYTIRNMRLAVRYIFTKDSQPTLAQAFGITPNTAGKAIRKFLRQLQEHCPPEIRQRYPEDPVQLLSESLPSASPKQPASIDLSSVPENKHPLAEKLLEAKTDDEINQIFGSFDYSEYISLIKIKPPVLYSVGSIVRNCHLTFSPRSIKKYLAVLEEAHIPVGLVTREVQTSGRKIEQHYYFIAAQHHSRACEALKQNPAQ
ncbi:hypothetical protein HYU95_04025 [Candidatus Daviesbacteria bacterium]|nr:hypothetical protein [Candidatus Daviesbacteria bacterium]